MSRVGGDSAAPIDRYTAAVDAFTVMIGRKQVASTTSSSRDFPHRFSGARMTRCGAWAHAGWAWLAAIHNTTASTASRVGRMTYRVIAAWTASRMAAPSTVDGSWLGGWGWATVTG